MELFSLFMKFLVYAVSGDDLKETTGRLGGCGFIIGLVTAPAFIDFPEQPPIYLPLNEF